MARHGPHTGHKQFWNALSSLRNRIREAAPELNSKIIDRRGEVYKIVDPELFDVDVWAFEHALAVAKSAGDDTSRIDALQRAASHYRGDLLKTTYYPWAEQTRARLRRQVLDALVQLAQLHQDVGEPDRALAALEQAITIDPYAEELYRRIMRLHADAGRTDAIKRTFHTLRQQLAELDVEPSAPTLELVQRLVEHGPVRHGDKA